jgi:hypothetical protein
MFARERVFARATPAMRPAVALHSQDLKRLAARIASQLEARSMYNPVSLIFGFRRPAQMTRRHTASVTFSARMSCFMIRRRRNAMNAFADQPSGPL